MLRPTDYTNIKKFLIILLSGFVLSNLTLISYAQEKPSINPLKVGVDTAEKALDTVLLPFTGAQKAVDTVVGGVTGITCSTGQAYYNKDGTPVGCVVGTTQVNRNPDGKIISVVCPAGSQPYKNTSGKLTIATNGQIGKDEEYIGCLTQPTSVQGTGLLQPGKINVNVRSYKTQIKIPCQGLIDGKCADPETPAGFISRLYQFGLMVVGLAAFGSIVWGALQYILAAGNVGKVEDAKEIIQQAIYGILLLLGAYLLLYTINPELVNLRNPKLEVIRIQNLAPPPEYNGLSQIGGNWSTGGIGVPAELCKFEVDAKITINGKDKTGGNFLSCVDNAQMNSA